MKELLYKSSYREIFYHADKKMIEMNYLVGTSAYSDQEYKKETEILRDYVKQKEVSLFYVSMVNFDYIIIPEMQKWVAETLQPILIKAGIKKSVIVNSEHIFTNVSVKQMINGFVKMNDFFDTRYFREEEKAMEWLLG